MSEIKLEVGKTYRNRKGEEVKIIGKDRGVRCLYKGSDGEWYAENGSFYCFFGETSRDLIEEDVEMVPEKEPKPGDVLVNTNGSVYIFKEAISRNKHKHFAWLGRSGRLVYNDVAISGRPATPEEAQPLWDALKKAGKRWNPVTQVVEEEITEIDHIREWVEMNIKDGYYNHEDVAEVIEAYLKHKEGGK